MEFKIETAQTIIDTATRICPVCNTTNKVDNVNINITETGTCVGYFLCKNCQNKYESIIFEVRVVA